MSNGANLGKLAAAIGGTALVILQGYTASQIPGIERSQEETKQELLIQIGAKHNEILEKIFQLSSANQDRMVKDLDEINAILKEQTTKTK